MLCCTLLGYRTATRAPTTFPYNLRLPNMTTKLSNMTAESSSAHAWEDLPSQLNSALAKASSLAEDDAQLSAFTTSKAITEPATFGIKAGTSDKAILCTVYEGSIDLKTGDPSHALFCLSATAEQWQNFFEQTPVAPYQSYWGMWRVTRHPDPLYSFKQIRADCVQACSA